MKRWTSWAVFLSLAFSLNGAVWANDPRDPVLPPPRFGGGGEGLGVGSLIDSAVMATEDGRVIVWGYRFNGHAGNYDYTAPRRGYEHGTYPSNFQLGRQMGSVRAFQDPSHHLYSQKIARLFTTAHVIFALTEEGELWSWGDSVNGVSGCIKNSYMTDYHTTGFGSIYTTSVVYDNGTVETGVRRPHYQARPCPVFSPIHPVPDFRKKVVYIDGGEYNAIVITDDGQVYTWGNDAFSQTVASGTYNLPGGRTVVVPSGNKGAPVNITNFFVAADGYLERVRLVGGAYEGQYAVSVDDRSGKHTLWGWGRSTAKNLASTSTAYWNDHYIPTPTRLTQYDHLADKIVYVNGGYSWTAVLLNDGTVWGSGRMNQLGQGVSSTTQVTLNPVKILGPGTAHPVPITQLIVRYSGGVAYSAREPYAFYQWGKNNVGPTLYAEVYGYSVIKREVPAGIKSLGATKEAIFYLDMEERLFGYGYSNQRVINLCGVYTISYDKSRNGNVRKNSMNWWRTATVGGGYRIPYEWAVDTVEDFCDGNVDGGPYNGQSKSTLSEWTGYFDGSEDLGPRPSSPPNLRCRYETPGDC